jgi:hypothetical protein
MRARLGMLLLLFLSATTLPGADKPRLTFSPEVWNFGMILQGTKVSLEISVTNEEPAALTVTLVPTCYCLSVEPSVRKIPPGGTQRFLLRYDSVDDVGVTRKDFVVQTDLPSAKSLTYPLRGTVRAERTAAPAVGAVGAQPAAGAGTSTAIQIAYFYTPGCRSCEEFLSAEIPALEKRLGVRIEVTRKDVLDPAAYEELARTASSRGEGVRAVPALLVGGVLLQGDAEIRARLEQVLAGAVVPAAAPASAAAPAAALAGVSVRLAILPVIGAGLIDGINPCAFTTLIFLLASLALAGRGRREVLVIGALFSLAVFLTYLAIGFGFFAALRAASVVPLVSTILRWALVAALVAFAGMSLYDYMLIRKGRPTEILLQLPAALKRRIHASIRTRVRTAALAGSSLVLGFLVSVFEFACTGQVDAIGLLVLYNLCFVTPLLVVFGASWLGVSSGRITALFQAHMGKVKLGLAAVFIGLAVFTLVG